MASAATAQARAGATEPKGIDAREGLVALKEQFGEEYADPIVASDGSVYMEARKPEVRDGRVVLNFALVARIDKATGRMLINPAFLDTQRSKRDPNAKLVKVEDRYFWQVMAKGADGKLAAKLDPVSDAELQAMSEQSRQQQVQQAQQEWNQDKIEWMRKLGSMSGLMKTVGYTGSLLNGLSAGPDTYTGKAGAHWMTGYMVLQMLDAQAEGKLLPQWMKSGVVGTALEWGMQGLFMLDIGRDLGTLGNAFPRAASAMRIFTAPTRAALNGVRSIFNSALAATAPAAAAASGAAQTVAGAGMITAGAGRVGLAGDALAAAAASAAAAQRASQTAELTSALSGLGSELRTGQVMIVGAQGTGLADKVAVMTREGALSLVPKQAVYDAMKLTDAPLKGGLKLQAGITGAMHGALGALRPYLRTLQVGGSILGTVAGALNLGLVVKNQGAKAVVTSRDGRGALFGFLGSAAFLGMMALPAMAALPQVGVLAAGLNVASNVFSGVSMLNYAGLFGGGGWLDHDAVRAAFLIPPLTPLGLFGMVMKRREKQAEAKAKDLEQRQATAVQNIAKLRGDVGQQLAGSGAVSGAKVEADGSLTVNTGITNDLSEVGSSQPAQPQVDESTGRLMRLVTRPMR